MGGDLAGDALEGMRMVYGRGDVAPDECRADFGAEIFLARDEDGQQSEVKLGFVQGLAQAGAGVEAFQTEERRW